MSSSQNRCFPEIWSFFSATLKEIDWTGGRIFIVGGSVRDALRPYGKRQDNECDLIQDCESSLDLDLCVEEAGGAQKLANALSERWGAKASKPHPLGAGYPIWQLMYQESPQSPQFEIQIADTQKEMFMDPDSRQRVTEFGNLQDDCRRRDFCYNMLYFDLLHEEVLDPSGQGLNDLEANRLSPHPEVSPAKMFSDDPLRILRMFRFHSRFNSAIDQSLKNAAIDCFDRTKILSPERVRDEWIKASKQGGLSEFFKTLTDWGLLEKLCPEFMPMLGCKQDKRFHSEGDVWQHTLLVMQKAEHTPLQQFTALLHDIAKPATQNIDGDRIKFLGHEKIGADMAQGFLDKWKFQKKLKQDIVMLVKLHLRGADVFDWATLKPARKLLKDCDGLEEEFLKFHLADSSATIRPDGTVELLHIPALREKLSLAKVAIQEKPPLMINGNDIKKFFGKIDGKEIGRLKILANELADDWLDQEKEFTVEDILAQLKCASKQKC